MSGKEQGKHNVLQTYSLAQAHILIVPLKLTPELVVLELPHQSSH